MIAQPVLIADALGMYSRVKPEIATYRLSDSKRRRLLQPGFGRKCNEDALIFFRGDVQSVCFGSLGGRSLFINASALFSSLCGVLTQATCAHVNAWVGRWFAVFGRAP